MKVQIPFPNIRTKKKGLKSYSIFPTLMVIDQYLDLKNLNPKLNIISTSKHQKITLPAIQGLSGWNGLNVSWLS